MKIRMLLLWCWCCCCGLVAAAQEADSVVEEITETQSVQPEAEQATAATDTAFIPNNLQLSPDTIRSLQKEEEFSYAVHLDSLLMAKRREVEKKVVATDSSPSLLERFFTADITRYVFWILAILFIAFIVKQLFFAEGFFQRTSVKSRIRISDEQELETTADTNFSLLIADAVRKGQYRQATRYLYLQLLQQLTASGAIQFAADKTNSEYLREISGKTYRQQVKQLMRIYEYVWYGEFEIGAEQFKQIQTSFNETRIG